MKPVERLKLFERLKALHPDWALSFLSGWVQGVSEEPRRRVPNPVLRRSADGMRPDKYAIGYMCGYADTRGPSTITGNWYGTSQRIKARK